MAEKILEILESGHLRKLDHISESVPVLELFSNIWGAGVKTAQMWYQQVSSVPYTGGFQVTVGRLLPSVGELLSQIVFNFLYLHVRFKSGFFGSNYEVGSHCVSAPS